MKKLKQMKKTTQKSIEQPEEVSGYLFFNKEKLDRVINGSTGSDGRLVGGLGKDASKDEILAEYDKLGGLIKTKDGQKVETGSFYDFKNHCAKTSVKIAEKANKKGILNIKTEEVGDEVKPKRKQKDED